MITLTGIKVKNHIIVWLIIWLKLIFVFIMLDQRTVAGRTSGAVLSRRLCAATWLCARRQPLLRLLRYALRLPQKPSFIPAIVDRQKLAFF